MMRIRRLFTIKTRFEAFLVIYAIAIGAVERGQHYLATYPGAGGWLLALACTGVVFVAGGKLLDAVRPQAAPVPAMHMARVARRLPSRSRPRLRPTRSGSVSAVSLRRD
ncbi:MAG: hypothetical protein LC656_00545 [Sphingomonadales bacterium]|nr:hypothetical protein [Sphingomonadales bacterium]